MESTPPISTNPYDRYIKAIYASGKLAKSFEKVLPKEVSDLIDYSQCERLDTSYINQNLHFTFSDVLLLFGLKNSNKKIGIILLLEHKSYADKGAFFQIGSYIMETWAREFIANDRIRAIIPVLFYHIGRNWPYPLSTVDYFQEDLEFGPFITYNPNFNIIPINLSNLNSLRQIGPLVLLAKAKDFKDKDDIVRWIKMSEFENESDLRFIYQCGYFIFSVTNIDYNIIIDTLKKDPGMQNSVVTEQIIKSALDIQFDKGLEKGIEKGIEKGVLKMLYSQIQEGKKQNISKEQLAKNIFQPLDIIEKYWDIQDEK